MSKTLVILNPHAGSGRAGKLWKQVEPMLWDRLGELIVAVTHHPEEVAPHLDTAYINGVTRVIAIGGDGTNHALINALVDLRRHHPEGPPVIYGTLPMGTGRDWARSQGIPLDVKNAADWLANAKPQPTDIGMLEIDEGQATYFLNIASAGIGGYVAERVNAIPRRRPWTFLLATIQSILSYQAQRMQISLDGEVWYDDRALVVVVANGTTFGHGMKIAPDASTHDGLFDVILIEALSRPRLLVKLWHVYNGSHLEESGVHFERAREVRVVSAEGPLSLDMDGEYAVGTNLTFTVQPGLLEMLG